ncbi:Lipid A export ATP-binding/permease protein MsbA [Balamuthia mandrillaris]
MAVAQSASASRSVSVSYVWPRLAGLLHQFRSLLLFALSLHVVAAFISATVAKFYGGFVDLMLERNVTGLHQLFALCVFFEALNVFIWKFRRYILTAKLGVGVDLHLRQQLYQHLQRHSLDIFMRHQAGELLTHFMADTAKVQRMVAVQVPAMLEHACMVTCLLVFMFVSEWRLSLILCVAFWWPQILLAVRVGARWQRYEVLRHKIQTRMNAVLVETLSYGGFLLTKLYGGQEFFLNRMTSCCQELETSYVSQYIEEFFRGWAMYRLMPPLGRATMLYVGGLLVCYCGDSVDVGAVVSFAFYLTKSIHAVEELVAVHRDMAGNFPSFKRYFDYLESAALIQDQPDALTLTKVSGAIDFYNVSFRYPQSQPLPSESKEMQPTQEVEQEEKEEEEEEEDEVEEENSLNVETEERWALRNVSFSVKAGQTVAFVGSSGAGKTTVTLLMQRFFDPLHGVVSVDSHDLRSVRHESLLKHIAIVSQDSFFFNDTIEFNLRFAKPNCTQEEMDHACQIANIYDFIMGLKHQYNAIGEGGHTLSGGQRQRLSIARAILKNTPYSFLSCVPLYLCHLYIHFFFFMLFSLLY